MGLDPASRPMKHRPHLKPGLLHPSEAGFNDPSSFVAKRDILGRQRVVVADHHELAVELFCGFDLRCIQLRTTPPIRTQVGRP
jgi:hypothetical protein